MSQNTFAFVLGRERELALEELKAVFHRFDFCFDVTSVSGNVVFANVDKSEEDVAKLIEVLAGVVKIFQLIPGPNSTKTDLAKAIAECRPNKSGKTDFGISSYTRKLSQWGVNSLGLEVKKELKKAGINSRFVALRDSNELSSIVVLKNKLIDGGIEIGLFESGVGALIALNNPEEWGERDYGKPAGDRYSGMVPPKLARMLVNIATEENSLALKNENIEIKSVVIDPFCGSGNILIEALLLGYDVAGSDVSSKAVLDTKQNLEWLAGRFPDLASSIIDIEQIDATTNELLNWLSSKAESLKLKSFIITEPYLGQPKKFKPSLNSARGEYRKIKDIYIKFLQNIKKLSDANVLALSNLCLVFPLVETSDTNRFDLFEESVDEIKKLGYIDIRPPLIYGRDYQVVKRKIVFLGNKS